MTDFPVCLIKINTFKWAKSLLYKIHSMKNIYLLLLFLSFVFTPLSSVVAQTEKIPVTQRDYENTEVSMADKFREDGKIYVVVAVLATIFAGIVVFLSSYRVQTQEVRRFGLFREK